MYSMSRYSNFSLSVNSFSLTLSTDNIIASFSDLLASLLSLELVVDLMLNFDNSVDSFLVLV